MPENFMTAIPAGGNLARSKSNVGSISLTALACRKDWMNAECTVYNEIREKLSHKENLEATNNPPQAGE